MELRIGELLVEAGILSVQQCREILARQRSSGEPFGLLSERLYGVDPEHIEQAWAQQYAQLTRTIDPLVEVHEPPSRELVTRRQAWQFRVLPIRFDGQELMIATTQRYLRRALGFTTRVIGVPAYLVLAEPLRLGEALCRFYPLPGMTPACVCDEGLDRLLGRRSDDGRERNGSTGGAAA